MKYLLAILLLCSAVFAQKTGTITSSGATCVSSVMDSSTTGPSNCVSVQLPNNANAVSIVISGTFSATLQFEISADNGNTWATASTPSTTTTGTYSLSITAYTHVRVRCSTYASGTVQVSINAAGAGPGGNGGNPVNLSSPGPVGLLTPSPGNFTILGFGASGSDFNTLAGLYSGSFTQQAQSTGLHVAVLQPNALPLVNNSAIQYTVPTGTLAAVGSFTPIPVQTVLTSQYTNSTASFTNLTGTNNMAWAVEAFSTHTIDCKLQYQAAATGGLNIEFTGPASPTNVEYSLLEPGSATTLVFAGPDAVAYSSSLGAAVTTATTNFTAFVHFTLINGATAGTVQLLAKSSAAVQLQVQIGSTCTFQ